LLGAKNMDSVKSNKLEMTLEQEKIIKLLAALFPLAKIYLFGSRARGLYSPTSDIDIALDMGHKMSIFDLAQARNVLEALYIPQKIDLVDIHAISDEMKPMNPSSFDCIGTTLACHSKKRSMLSEFITFVIIAELSPSIFLSI
jgi:predicted nucleotidyltransferase